MIALATALVWGPSSAADDFGVSFESPEAGVPVFGEVELRARVWGRDEDDIRGVSFFVDDAFIVTVDAPPWRTTLDVGQANRSRRFEAVAEAVDGSRASALLVSRPIRVDDEVELRLRQLYVTVERAGKRVLDLGRDDFAVYEGGRRQALVTFERGDVPITALLLVDASDSMRGEPLAAAVAGASAFVDGMEELDQARLVLFSDTVLHGTPFTNVSEVLKAGLSGVEARGGTALDDHLYLALHELEQRQGRRVVVLLSDGIDVSSWLDMDQVLDTARRSRALVYWLRLGGDRPNRRYFSAWRNDLDYDRELEQLSDLIRQSGGRVVPMAAPQEASESFRRILAELRDQYVLGYYPNVEAEAGTWRPVEVRLEDVRLDVRARAGYVAD
ncbi:MAG: VWA domain-containing protein [Acidobacteriota bacterium]